MQKGSRLPFYRKHESFIKFTTAKKQESQLLLGLCSIAIMNGIYRRVALAIAVDH